MPIRKDNAGNRLFEMDLLVPGTPEQVWHAMATGVGSTAWFAAAQVDEHIGGRIRFDLGPEGDSAGEVTAWEHTLGALC